VCFNIDLFVGKVDIAFGVACGYQATFLQKKEREKIMKKIAMAVLLSVFVAVPAMAENFYGALDVGQATGKDICTNLPGVGCEDTAIFFRFAVGYQFSPMWGAEASYANYGKSNLISSGGFSADWEATGLQISGTGTFPIGDKFSIIGKLGIASTDIRETSNFAGNVNETTTKLAYGIGVQYDFTEKVSGRAQYEDMGTVGNDATTGASKVTLLSAGVVYKF
jgi:OmpA-OmpF porin, OOP family